MGDTDNSLASSDVEMIENDVDSAGPAEDVEMFDNREQAHGRKIKRKNLVRNKKKLPGLLFAEYFKIVEYVRKI